MQGLNLKAVLLAVSLIGASASAYANPVLGPDQSASPNIETYDFAHAGFADDGAFTHWLSFTVDGPRNLSAAISGNASGGNTFFFTGFDLYTAYNDDVLSTVGRIAVGDVSNLFGKIAFGGQNADVGGPATYWLKISGTSNTVGDTLAIYNGNITAAVPEPSTYGMLALGLGLIGFAARGRSKFSA